MYDGWRCLRYGQLYGPGTYYPDPGALPDPPRISVAEAAARTIELLELSATVCTLADA